MSASIRPLIAGFACFALCGLGSWPGLLAQTAVAPPEPPATIAESAAAVPEDINQTFKDPDMDVSQFVERFEGESREIFACRDRILDVLQLQPGMRVADVGAGTGYFSRLMARRVGEHGWVYAVDISPAFIRHVADVNRTQGIQNVTAVLCAEDSINLPEESVDVVFICDTYHHFAYPDKTMASINRSLKLGGYLWLIDFEREVGKSRDWVLQHVRAGKRVFRDEIVKAGLEFQAEVPIDGFHENYMLRFRKTK